MNFCSFPPPKPTPSSLPPSPGYTLLLLVLPLLVSLLLTTILLATLLLICIILSACNILAIYAVGSMYLLQLYVSCPYSPEGGVPLRPLSPLMALGSPTNLVRQV